jgi:16S rRNA (guanine1207-N2)-methyltransferase
MKEATKRGGRRLYAADAPSEAAAAVMIGALDKLELGPTPLVVDEASGRLTAALTAAGARPQVWSRYADGSSAAPWPQPGPLTSALIRLPKAKASLDFSLSAAASMLPAGAPLVVFGANSEGIRSAPLRLGAFVDSVATIDTRRHCRVLMGSRRAEIAGLRSRLSDWRHQGTIAIDGKERPWVTYPGVFAEGRLDEGTALLLSHLPALPIKARVLDFGCGTGIIGACVLTRHPHARVELLDADALAITAAQENVPHARLILGTNLAATTGTRYDAIISNPPVHVGVAEHHGVLARLIDDAPRHLTARGMLVLVVQRRIRAAELMQEAFGHVETIAEDSRFRVLRSASPVT